MSMLKETFISLIKNYTNDDAIIQTLWKEIESKHSVKKRFYHNLSHLEKMLQELESVKSQITDWNSILFSLFYHDFIYSTVRHDNEERSSNKAKVVMQLLSVPVETIAKTEKTILATKKHSKRNDNDVNLFLDADLTILGQEWDDYLKYAHNIRKEYAVFPNLIFNSARRLFLNNIFALSRIFITDYFYDKYEKKARYNVDRELEIL